MKFPVARFICQPCLSLGLVLSASLARESFGWSLLPAVQVDATGIYLDQLVTGASAEVPHLRLAPAPAPGRVVAWQPAQINALLQPLAPELVTTNWSGAAQVKVGRRMRTLAETEIKELLTAKLQDEYVKDKGDLELRFTRAIPPASVVDEALTVKIVDLPNLGVTPNFVARFDLMAGDEVVGNWQIPVQARIWREVLVAGAPLRRGQLLREADLAHEKRDLLTTRDALTSVELDNNALELAENISTGLPLTSRSLRLRAIIHRGKLADAIVQDGAMTVTVKVEVLEDGLPGQSIRVRNLKSKKEFRGKVQNEETIFVTL